MSPGSEEQLFEQRLDQLGREIDETVRFAEQNPAVLAVQGIRTQLLLSYLREWRRVPVQLRVVV